MKISSVHERIIGAPAAEAGALLDRLSSADDPVFPSPAWAPMQFDRPLSVGAAGGHGPVEYTVKAYEPGRQIHFTFAPPADGFHQLEIEPLDAERCRVRHVLEQNAGLAELMSWKAAIRPVHDTMVEELLDNFELVTTGSVKQPVRWARRVRLLNRLDVAKPQSATPQGVADYADAWQVELRRGMSRAPTDWCGPLARFPVLRRTDNSVVLGEENDHLRFHAEVSVGESAVTISTYVWLHDQWGRLYFAVVRRVHPMVVRWLLRRTFRRIALAAPTAGERERKRRKPARHSTSAC